MALEIAFAGLMLLQAAGAADTGRDVAQDALLAQDNQAAITRIEHNDALDPWDPARLINLAIAYAGEGDADKARTLLYRAIRSDQWVDLQTANGEWVNSRELARKVLAMIDEGRLGGGNRLAAR